MVVYKARGVRVNSVLHVGRVVFYLLTLASLLWGGGGAAAVARWSCFAAVRDLVPTFLCPASHSSVHANVLNCYTLQILGRGIDYNYRYYL